MPQQLPPPFSTTRHIAISRLQSAVATVLRRGLAEEDQLADTESVRQRASAHPMMVGMNLFVARHNGGSVDLSRENVEAHIDPGADRHTIHPLVHAYLAARTVERIRSEAMGPEASAPPQLLDLNGHLAGFPDSDYAYAQWALAAAEFLKQGNPYPSPYVKVSDHGGPESDFGVFTIPADAKILLIGDFGTGLDDATSMLIAALTQLEPDFVIHLGDVYYSGTPDECATYCSVFQKAMQVSGVRPYVFSLPGNHEYISGGGGYFDRVLGLNKLIHGENPYEQRASYFSLRTADGHWQFLGMDTGYNSVRTHTWNLSGAYSPWLEFGEAAWHRHKLATWSGRNILLSHHQLLSAFEVINDGDHAHYQSSASSHVSPDSLRYFNGNLNFVFREYGRSIPVWFWGHEHSLNIFDTPELPIKGRLIGNSGYEEYEDEVAPPHVPGTKGSPWKIDPDVRVGTSSVEFKNKIYEGSYQFLNHAFAFVQLAGAGATVDYYEHPLTPITTGFQHLDPKPLGHLYREQF